MIEQVIHVAKVREKCAEKSEWAMEGSLDCNEANVPIAVAILCLSLSAAAVAAVSASVSACISCPHAGRWRRQTHSDCIMSTVSQVGEVFSAAGTAFSKLSELTALLQVADTAPSQG